MMQQAVAEYQLISLSRQTGIVKPGLDQGNAIRQTHLSQRLLRLRQHRGRPVDGVNTITGVSPGKTNTDIGRAATQINGPACRA